MLYTQSHQVWQTELVPVYRNISPNSARITSNSLLQMRQRSSVVSFTPKNALRADCCMAGLAGVRHVGSRDLVECACRARSRLAARLEVMGDGKQRQLQARGNAELIENISQMTLDGELADTELVADISVV
jgi:hypothetical protein